MKFRKIQRRNPKDVVLEMTPLLDVIFLLLIFFMVSTTFVDIDTGINIKLPQSTLEEVMESRELIIAINGKKTIYVKGKGKLKPVSLENLESVLKNEMNDMKKSNVIIKADKNIEYGFVVRVMTRAKKAGATELDIATELEK